VIGPPIHAPSANPFFRDSPAACAGAASASASQSTGNTFAEDHIARTLRRRVLALDQVSFLTGCPSPNLQAAYLIHTVRGDPELKQRVVSCFSADQCRAQTFRRRTTSRSCRLSTVRS
jgi:hypothetical protein